MKKILLMALAACLAMSARAAGVVPERVTGEGSSDAAVCAFEGDQPYFNTTEIVYPGMKYKEYKDYYDPRMYVPDVADPYKRFWPGFASFLIPGLGQGIDGEWGRGAWMFATNVALSLASTSQVTLVYNQYGELTGINRKPMYWVFSALNFAFAIYSTIDAVNIAKVKNMYYQDLRAQRSSVDMHFQPFVTCLPQGMDSRLQPAAGLSMVVSF